MATERKPLYLTLDSTKQFELPTTASAVGLDLNTGKQLYYNTSSLDWVNQEVITVTDITSSHGITFIGDQVDLSVDDGLWLDDLSSGTVTRNTTNQTIDFSVNSGVTGYANTTHTISSWIYSQDFEMKTRIASYSSDSDDGLYFLITNSRLSTPYIGLKVTSAGNVNCETNNGAGSSVNVSNILAGQGWLRVVVKGPVVYAYAGVGSSGNQPTIWTPCGNVLYSSGFVSPWTTLRMMGYRNSAISSANLTISLDKIHYVNI